MRDKDVVNTIGRIEYLTNVKFESVEKYISQLIDSDNNCLYAIYTNSKKFIGTVKIGHINWRTGVADIGIMIGEKIIGGEALQKKQFALLLTTHLIICH